MSTSSDQSEAIRSAIRERYARSANQVLLRQQASCCGPATAGSGCCSGEAATPYGVINYRPDETRELPEEAVLASLGCGNPVALAKLEPGQVVLDLGSGGGIDVLLSAKRVGADGFVYGLDMTDEMLELAERNRQAAGVGNVAFLKGHIEAIPLPDASVDVIISNCVINLSADKDAVLRESYRVLRPGGLFAVSDVVVRGELSAEVRASTDSWTGCVAGALEEQDYLRRLAAAGFRDPSIEATAQYDASAAGSCCGSEASDGAGNLINGFIRARK